MASKALLNLSPENTPNALGDVLSLDEHSLTSEVFGINQALYTCHLMVSLQQPLD